VIREDGSRIRPRISFEKAVKAQQRVAIALQTVAYRVLSVRFERLSPKRRQSPYFMARFVGTFAEPNAGRRAGQPGRLADAGRAHGPTDNPGREGMLIPGTRASVDDFAGVSD
jgi:hypothetical protein